MYTRYHEAHAAGPQAPPVAVPSTVPPPFCVPVTVAPSLLLPMTSSWISSSSAAEFDGARDASSDSCSALDTAGAGGLLLGDDGRELRGENGFLAPYGSTTFGLSLPFLATSLSLFFTASRMLPHSSSFPTSSVWAMQGRQCLTTQCRLVRGALFSMPAFKASSLFSPILTPVLSSWTPTAAGGGPEPVSASGKPPRRMRSRWSLARILSE